MRNKRVSNFIYLSGQDVEKELEIQISMRQEMEMAMKMLEKDVCEKQDALVCLRQQLDDLRALKHELAFKLQVGNRRKRLVALKPQGFPLPLFSLESHFKYKRKESTSFGGLPPISHFRNHRVLCCCSGKAWPFFRCNGKRGSLLSYKLISTLQPNLPAELAVSPISFYTGI